MQVNGYAETWKLLCVTVPRSTGILFELMPLVKGNSVDAVQFRVKIHRVRIILYKIKIFHEN